MSDDRDLRYWATHPGAIGTAAVGTLAGGTELIEPLLTFLTGTVGTWFPLLSTLSSIANVVPALPADTFQTLFLIGAVGYTLLLAGRLVNDALEK